MSEGEGEGEGKGGSNGGWDESVQDEQLRREEEKEEGVQMNASSPMSCFRVPSLMVTCTFMLGTVPNCLCCRRGVPSEWEQTESFSRLGVSAKGGEKEVKERAGCA